MKIEINLENCYGIRKLEHEFGFTKTYKVYSIYAPNGSMKTSLAKTFKDLSEQKESKDLIFPERITKRAIKKDDADIQAKEIFVVEPYIEDLDTNKNIATLLINKKLKKEYDEVYSKINTTKNTFLEKMKELSGLKSGVEEEISKVFMQGESNKFIGSLKTIEARMDNDSPNFENIKYNEIFETKILNFLDTPEAKKNIKEYIEKYDELIDQSTYFKKGIFNHSQAEDVAKQLTKNGFFEADHSVLLKDGKRISTEEELRAIIKAEKKNILQDKELRKTFDDLDKKIS